jgi:hypothetical protein
VGLTKISRGGARVEIESGDDGGVNDVWMIVEGYRNIGEDGGFR